MANAVQFQIASTGARRIVGTSPVVRPQLRSPQAHPDRQFAAGRSAAAVSCVGVTRPVERSPWLTLKVVAVGLLAAVGATVSVQQFVAMGEPNPATEYVAGDPAWAHVNP